MLRRTTRGSILLGLSLVVFPVGVHAEEVSPEDENVNAIRKEDSVGERLVAQWVQAKVDKLAAAPENKRHEAVRAFRQRFTEEYRHPDNSEAYRVQLAAQTASIAAAQFAKHDVNPAVADGLAYALAVMDQVETFPGFVAGLKSPEPIVRYLCAKGLAEKRGRVATDRVRLDESVQALREAGLVETSPVVLSRIYQALNCPSQVAAVFDAYLAVFDKRLAYRRGPGVIVDGAEIDAYEFFRTGGVLGTLNADQKATLARRLAVFLRLDAQRYMSPDLEDERQAGAGDEDRKVISSAAYYERSRIEQMLDAVEEILAAIVGTEGGTIRDELKQGGYARREQVLQQAYRWVGHPETKESGVLNEAPWNVEIGAP